jgi:hypothetical protein
MYQLVLINDTDGVDQVMMIVPGGYKRSEALEIATEYLDVRGELEIAGEVELTGISGSEYPFSLWRPYIG